MALITRTYFDTPDYTVTYEFDNVALKIVALHVDNRTGAAIDVQICLSADDSVLDTETMPPGHTDVNLTPPRQRAVVLDARGRITNLYARTV